MRALNFFLGAFLSIIALNAIGGGIYGMTGAKGVPLQWLEGTPFRSYFFPSLLLFVMIGGSCSFAAIAVLRRQHIARKAASGSALLLLAWIIVQVLMIGYVSWLQPAIFFSALALLPLARFISTEKMAV
jgi:hypothetical protein